MAIREALREIAKETADIQTLEASPSIAHRVEHIVDRLDECTKLKWMTQSKITGETYQMVPIDLIYEVAALLLQRQAMTETVSDERLRELIGQFSSPHPVFTKGDVCDALTELLALRTPPQNTDGEAGLVERLIARSELHRRWDNWELGQVPTPGPLFHGETADDLAAAASLLSTLKAELYHLRNDLSNARDHAHEVETRLSAERERQWCLSCGTVTQTGECDCTKIDQPESQRLVNYADELRKDFNALRAERDALAKVVSEFLAFNDEGPGLIDCIDNDGERYTSMELDQTIKRARSTLKGDAP